MEYLLPSAVLATVGTMYTIFVAVAVFSAKYFDQDLKLMKQLRSFFLLLSVVVLITVLYNGYILYLQSSGIYGNSTYIQSEDFLYWSWTSFYLSTVYIFLFSYFLLSSVLAQICIFKLKKLETKNDKLDKLERNILLVFDRRDEKLAKLKEELQFIDEKSEEFVSKFGKKLNELYDKLEIFCEKDENLKSKFVPLDIKKIINFKNDSSDNNKYSLILCSKLGTFLVNLSEICKNISIEIQTTEDFPEDWLKELTEFKQQLHDLTEELRNFTEQVDFMLYSGNYYTKQKEYDYLDKLNEEIKERDIQIRKEMEEIKSEIQELKDTVNSFLTVKINRLLKKYLYLNK